MNLAVLALSIWAMHSCHSDVLGVNPNPKNPAQCINKFGEPVWTDGVPIPPAKYDHVPSMPYFVETVDRKHIDSLCSVLDNACTYYPTEEKPFCISFVQRKYDDDSNPIHILIHERAHCNGWHHHEDAQ